MFFDNYDVVQKIVTKLKAIPELLGAVVSRLNGTESDIGTLQTAVSGAQTDIGNLQTAVASRQRVNTLLRGFNTGSVTINIPNATNRILVGYAANAADRTFLIIVGSTSEGGIGISTVYKGDRLTFTAGTGTVTVTLASSGNSITIVDMPNADDAFATVAEG